MKTELEICREREHHAVRRRFTRPKGPRGMPGGAPHRIVEYQTQVDNDPIPEQHKHDIHAVPAKRPGFLSRIKSFSRRIMGK